MTDPALPPPPDYGVDRRLALLAEAGLAVNAAVDTEDALERLMRVLVPAFADYAAVWLLPGALEADGPAGETTLRARAEDPQRWVGATVRRAAAAWGPDVPRPDFGTVVTIPPGNPLVQVFATHRGNIIPLVPDTDPAQRPYRDGVADWVRRARGHSLLNVALLNRGNLVGALTLMAAGERPAYTEGDIAYTEEFAARVAVAIDRAQVLRRTQDVAVTLQRSLLPDSVPQPDELDVAVRYVSGVADTEVGGDVWDVIDLGAGRWGLLIGDVMGRGVHAAAVMGQLRSAVRAYARLDLAPAHLMDLLDGLVADLGQDRMATAIYGIYDPATAQLTYASAGHPPPLLVGGDHAVQPVEGLVGPPLGVGDGGYVDSVVGVPAGSVVALYTDGLIETRGRDIGDGLSALSDSLGAPIPALEELADHALGVLGRADGHHDDVCLLLARSPGGQPGKRLHLELEYTGASVSRARTSTTEFLAQQGLLDVIGDSVVLVVSELVTNAVTHGSSSGAGTPRRRRTDLARPDGSSAGVDMVELRLRCGPRTVVVEVCDSEPVLPQRRPLDAEAQSGRGMHLVHALARRTGNRATEHGKAVWAEIAIPAGWQDREP